MSTLFKIWGQLFLIIGFILIWVGWISFAEKLTDSDPESIRTNVIPVIAAITSITIVLGGFAIKQYMNYKNKWVEFLNDVTQTLFFRNLGVNAGVFQSIIDAAEEEECKEAILAYYHLLTNDQKFTKPELDRHIEKWFQEQFNTAIDFDIEDALQKLERLKGRIAVKDQEKETYIEKNLITEDENGKLDVRPLDESIQIMDCIWDNIFQYNGFLILEN